MSHDSAANDIRQSLDSLGGVLGFESRRVLVVAYQL